MYMEIPYAPLALLILTLYMYFTEYVTYAIKDTLLKKSLKSGIVAQQIKNYIFPLMYVVFNSDKYMYALIFNPLRMRSRVTVVCLSVCVSVTVLTARVLILAVQAWY